MLEYIISQVFVAFAIVVNLLYNFFKVSKSTILYCQIIISLSNACAFVLLHAWTGAILNIVCIFLCIVCFYKNKNKFLSSIFTPIFFTILFIAVGVLTWDSWISILAILANVFYTLMIWLNNERLIKSVGIIVNIFWLAYNVFVKSYVAVAGIGMLIIITIIYLIWGDKYNNYLRKLFDKKNNKNC